MAYNPDKIKKIVLLGVQGENLAVRLEFNMSSWAELYPQGAYSLILKRPGDLLPYAVNTIYDSETKILTWLVSSIDTALEGDGQAEIICVQDEIIDKSFIFDVSIEPCLDPTGDVPEPLEDWYQRMIQVELNTKQYRDEAKGYAEDIEDLTVSAHGLPAGSDPTVTKSKQEGQPYNLDFGIPSTNVLYATFSIDIQTGQLVMITPEGYQGIDFRINEQGYMEVIINA